MTYSLKRIGVIQLGKFLAVLYLFLALIAAPFLLVSVFAGPESAAYGIGMIVGVLLFYPIAGFVFGMIFALLFNLVAKMVGGVLMEFEER
ncbi:MAG: hypothetical protein ACFB21_13260 [Opitutales bacterium]